MQFVSDGVRDIREWIVSLLLFSPFCTLYSSCLGRLEGDGDASDPGGLHSIARHFCSLRDGRARLENWGGARKLKVRCNGGSKVGTERDMLVTRLYFNTVQTVNDSKETLSDVLNACKLGRLQSKYFSCRVDVDVHRG